MPFCARCLGAAIGHTLAALNFFTAPLPPWYLGIAGCMLMYADWYLQNKKLWYHSNIMRLITGLAGGYSVGIWIWHIVQYFVGLIHTL